MSEISASTVMKLRKLSGQGMMDCKQALQQAAGDIDKAIEILRKKGLSTLAKRADRMASEGLLVSTVAEDGRTAAMATLCCETDFVAKSDDFKQAASMLADYAAACADDSGIESLMETVVRGRTLADIVTEAVSKTGEKIIVGDYARFSLDGPGAIGTYVHFNGKVGAMVELGVDNEAAAAALGKIAIDVAMHITAVNPLAVDPEGIDATTVEKEKAIFAEQVKNKPPEIVEKIVAGKVRKFYADNCLIEQPFVKDDSKTVSQVLSEAVKQAGGAVKVRRFVRFGIG